MAGIALGPSGWPEAKNWKETMADPTKQEEHRRETSRRRPGDAASPGRGLWLREFVRHTCTEQWFTGTAAFDPDSSSPTAIMPSFRPLTLLSGSAQAAVERRFYRPGAVRLYRVPAEEPCAWHES
jgi:hypothetical protein